MIIAATLQCNSPNELGTQITIYNVGGCYVRVSMLQFRRDSNPQSIRELNCWVSVSRVGVQGYSDSTLTAQVGKYWTGQDPGLSLGLLGAKD